MSSSSPAQVQPYAKHRSTRINKRRGLAKRRAEQVVVGQALFSRVIQHIQHVHEQLGSPRAAQADRPRQAEIDERLRRQPARAARLEQNALVALRQDDLRRCGPWLAAEVLPAVRTRRTRALRVTSSAQRVRFSAT